MKIIDSINKKFSYESRDDDKYKCSAQKIDVDGVETTIVDENISENDYNNVCYFFELFQIEESIIMMKKLLQYIEQIIPMKETIAETEAEIEEREKEFCASKRMLQTRRPFPRRRFNSSARRHQRELQVKRTKRLSRKGLFQIITCHMSLVRSAYKEGQKDLYLFVQMLVTFHFLRIAMFAKACALSDL
ncbi:MAG: hypothetical protein EZS28_011847 [Streblomastix strix]|uniref:Uncharacterized protein n=1 Tax=Streblomastix strix TaxID=222440 RepID=A0A5J4WD67_9EUKA|nr:MAG: hypothetical protein EZS28_011847 [Streblomastix strix]